MSNIESLYLHFPFCKHLCNYCDFYKTIPSESGQDLQSFHQFLDESFTTHEKFRREHQLSWAPLKTLYIGGGTPSLWGSHGASYFKNWLKEKKLELASNTEFTMEVNPATWTEDSLKSWIDTGVNRYSIGIQSYRQEYLEILDRLHDFSAAKKTLEKFSSMQTNFSLDLMLGLPYSLRYKRDVIEELKRLLDYGPSHFSVYILTVKNQYKHFKELPSEEFIEEEYLKVAEFLKYHGFSHYEVSNFSLPKKESKHNYRYWNAETVAALGPSATGFLAFKDQGIRYKWKTSEAKMELEFLGLKELLLEKIYLSLRTNEGLKFGLLKKIPKELFYDWERRGFATVLEEKVILTSRGYLLMDSLLQDLMKKDCF